VGTRRALRLRKFAGGGLHCPSSESPQVSTSTAGARRRLSPVAAARAQAEGPLSFQRSSGACSSGQSTRPVVIVMRISFIRVPLF